MGVSYVRIKQNTFILFRYSTMFFFKLIYIHAAKACLTHSLNHLLNRKTNIFLSSWQKTQHTLFIGENQISIKNNKSVTINSKQVWFSTNAHTAPPNDFLFPFLWTTSAFPLSTLSFRYGLYFQEMYTASCMVGSSALI